MSYLDIVKLRQKKFRSFPESESESESELQNQNFPESESESESKKSTPQGTRDNITTTATLIDEIKRSVKKIKQEKFLHLVFDFTVRLRLIQKT